MRKTKRDPSLLLELAGRANEEPQKKELGAESRFLERSILVGMVVRALGADAPSGARDLREERARDTESLLLAAR